MVIVMVFIIKDVSGKSGRYFGAQQKNLGIENSFIERNDVWSKSGQGLYCMKEKALRICSRINDQLFESSYQANRYANVLLPNS